MDGMIGGVGREHETAPVSGDGLGGANPQAACDLFPSPRI